LHCFIDCKFIEFTNFWRYLRKVLMSSKFATRCRLPTCLGNRLIGGFTFFT